MLNNLLDLLKYRAALKKNEKAAPHEKAYWINETIKKLGINPKTKEMFNYGHINGKVGHWPTEWIKEFYLHCSRSDNFGRLWWGLLKKSENEKHKGGFDN